MRPETEGWWRQAEADLHAAEVNADARLYFVVAWYAQQSTEKAIKALYVERHGLEPPRTHAVQFLGRDLEVPATVQIDLDAVAPAFAQARYPMLGGQAPVDAISASTAERYLTAARRVLQWLESELERPASPD